MHSEHGIGWMGGLALASAIVAALLLARHLWRNPPLTAAVKVSLLFGLGVFPIFTAGTANIAGFRATQSREFCGSCHVMTPHARDSSDYGNSLAALHARNKYFGRDNCYTCHKDYGMYGYVLTKLGGMRHVWLYLTEYRSMPLEKAQHDIRTLKPFSNGNCMECHTTTAPRWLALGDHASSLPAVRSGTLACASPGCHGFAHPMTKLGRELLLDGGSATPLPPRVTGDGGAP